MAKAELSGLTAKQEAFCQFYTVYWNATRAAKEAGYSEKTSEQLGYQLLQIPSVKARVAELTEHAMKEAGITRERVLHELGRIAFADMSQAFDSAGFLKPLSEMPEDLRCAISGIDSDEIFAGEGSQRSIIGHARKVKFHSKERALELLGKHLKLFADRLEHSGPDGKPIETRQVEAMPEAQLDAEIGKLLTLVPKVADGSG